MRLGRLLLLLVVAACGNRPSGKLCDKVVDHMIDIIVAPRVAEGQTAPPDAIKDAETWKEILKKKDASRTALTDACRTRMTDSSASCVLAAQDEVSLAACLK